MILYYLISSVMINFLFIIIALYYFQPLKKGFKKFFLKQNSVFHIRPDHTVEEHILPKKADKLVKIGDSLVNVDPLSTYKLADTNTQAYFQLGEEPRTLNFFKGSYAEEVREVYDEDSKTVSLVGRIYPAGDGQAKIYQNNALVERMKGKLMNQGLDLKVWILIIVGVLVLLALVVGFWNHSFLQQILEKGGQLKG